MGASRLCRGSREPVGGRLEHAISDCEGKWVRETSEGRDVLDVLLRARPGDRVDLRVLLRDEVRRTRVGDLVERRGRPSNERSRSFVEGPRES